MLGDSEMISTIQNHILVIQKYFSKEFLFKICVLVIVFYCYFFLGVQAENLRGLALFPLSGPVYLNVNLDIDLFLINLTLNLSLTTLFMINILFKKLYMKFL